MNIEEALEFAGEWIKGVTVYEGSQGWRVACATLATEVITLRVELTKAQDEAYERAALVCEKQEKENCDGELNIYRECANTVHALKSTK